MAIPEQVRKQSEAVRKLYDDLNEDGQDSSPVQGEGQPVTAEESVVVSTDGGSSTDEAPLSVPDEQVTDSQDTYEQKFKTLQGMHGADVARFTAENQALSQRLVDMEQLITTMSSTPVATQEPKVILTDDELEEYGDSIGIMRKVTEDVVSGYQQQLTRLQDTINHMQGSIVPRVEQIATQQAQTADQSFWSALAVMVPNWQDINGDPAFQSWLLDIDPLSGLSKQAFLTDAQRNMDVGRVAGFFTSWQQANGIAAHTGSPRSTSELEKQVSPGKSRGDATPQGEQQKIYTRQDITDFFTDVRKGVYKGREEDRGKIERDIFAAQQEGRIVNA